MNYWPAAGRRDFFRILNNVELLRFSSEQRALRVAAKKPNQYSEICSRLISLQNRKNSPLRREKHSLP
jgi:hypothetical protein